MNVAFVRRMDVHRRRAQCRVTRFLENHCLGHVGQPKPAHFARGVGCQQPMGTGFFHQYLAQLGRGAVWRLPEVALHRDDFISNKATDFGLQRKQLVSKGKVHSKIPQVLETFKPWGLMVLNRFSRTVWWMPALCGL
ncbi:hypothetical protein D3C80_1555690 [compost metagenome]